MAQFGPFRTAPATMTSTLVMRIRSSSRPPRSSAPTIYVCALAVQGRGPSRLAAAAAAPEGGPGADAGRDAGHGCPGRLGQRAHLLLERGVLGGVHPPPLELLPLQHRLTGVLHAQAAYQFGHGVLEHGVAGDEVDARVVLVVGQRGVVEDEVRAFLEVLVEVGVL